MDASSPTIVDRVLSPLRLAVGFVFVAVMSTICMAVLLVFLPWRGLRVRVCNVYGKVVGRVIQFIGGVSPVVRNRERMDASFPAIYVTNHTSVMDVFVSIWICPFGGCGVAKKEIGNIPFFGWMYRLSGHLLIDRADRKGAIAAFDEIAQAVRRHNLGIWIWPEGTRSRDGRLLPLKKGFAHLALATGLPVVPVVLHNAHKNWEKHSFVLRPVTIEVDVLEAIPTTDWTVDNLDEKVAGVHAAFARALGPEQKPLGNQAVALERPRPEVTSGNLIRP